ncbi:hypothetical protein PENSPDRAFT_683157 [Peniophora sp. CONT]|nr:hypothetical protein PENSPDRAFT_683157 [Peniophora sp. CONT]
MSNCLTKCCVLVVYLCSFASTIGAQTLTIPVSWRAPTSNLSLHSRESLAYEAALPLTQMDLSVGHSSLPYVQDVISVYAVLALQDYHSGNSTWRNMGTDNLQALIQKFGFWFGGPDPKGGGEGINSDATYMGLTLFYSYRTYKEQILLDTAVDVWNLIYYGAFITLSNAASGNGAGRNVSFSPPANCTGGTFAGGVFRFYNVLNDTFVDMVSTGPFMTLSAYLFEETKNVTYQQTAQLSLDFVLNHLWNGSIVYTSLNLSSCQIIDEHSLNNQAWFVEGASVLANITRNNTLSTLLESVVPSVTTFWSWTSPNGIVNDTTLMPVNPGIFIRGLAEVRRRNPGTDLARYIGAYITVQFNAVLDNARAPAPNDSYYSRPWSGPSVTPFDINGNIAALDVLNAALDLATPSSDPPSGGSTPTSTSAKSPKIGAIAGGVVGGVVVVGALVAAAQRCRRRHEVANKVNDPVAIRSVKPFTSRTARNPPASGKLLSRRVNEADQDGVPSLQASHSAISTSDPIGATSNTINGQGSVELPPIEVAEIPSLIQRLNDFLQGRQNEPPPRYNEQD